MKFKDYYQIMGVASGATQDEIKRAYRKLARKYHPDVSKEANAEERFKEVNEAYEVLKDPEKRKAYDQLGANWKAGQEFHPPPGWDQGFEFGDGGFTDADAAHFSDFFEALFGGRRARGAGAGFRVAGGDQHARIGITLEDAYNGGTRTIELSVPDIDPRRRKAAATRTLRVTIPKGITEGQQIRLAGQGSKGVGGGPAGDLYLEVSFEPHPLFRAEGRDVFLNVPITPWEAALGARLTVPTLGGKVDMTVPPGSQSGQQLRLKGRGLPATPPGDQYVVLQVVAPAPRNDRERGLYEQMRREMPFNPRGHLGV